MISNVIYMRSGGHTYIRVEQTELAREKQSFRSLIQIAEEKLAALKLARSAFDADSVEAEDRIDEINDLEIAIDDLNVHLERLINIPKSED